MNRVLDDYDGQMIPGVEFGQNFLTFVLELRKNTENPKPEIDPTGHRTRAHCVRGNDVTPRPIFMLELRRKNSIAHIGRGKERRAVE